MRLFWLLLCLLLISPAQAAEPTEDEPSELEKTVRRLAAIRPDEEAIDYLAGIDPRTGRPKAQRGKAMQQPKDGEGKPLSAVIAQLGREDPADDAGAIYHMVLSADARLVATGHCSGRVQLFDTASGRLVRQVRADRGHLTSVAFSPDGKVLATAGGGWRQVELRGIHLWDVATGRELAEFGVTDRTRALAFAPDGESLAAGGWDNEIHIWDPATGKKLRSFAAEKVPMLAFTPDGSKLAAATDGGSFAVYDPTTGKQLMSMPPARGGFGSFVVVAPDGRRLAVGNQAKTQIYDLEADKFLPPQLPGARRGAAYRSGAPVAFSPDSKALACADAIIRLFDAATGQEQRQLRGSRAATLVYPANGKTLVSGDDNGRVLIWDMTDRAGEIHPRAVTFSARELDALGRSATGADAVRAYTALLTLGAVPRETLWLYREEIARPADASPDRIKRLIADLDSPRFEARQRAGTELLKLGDWSVGPLRRALADKPPLEMKQRIQRLLDELDPALPSADRLLALHAVDLLERIGTPEAGKILERLASGAAANPVTADAKAALKRLTKQP
jgi:hypothetical protein